MAAGQLPGCGCVRCDAALPPALNPCLAALPQDSVNTWLSDACQAGARIITGEPLRRPRALALSRCSRPACCRASLLCPCQRPPNPRPQVPGRSASSSSPIQTSQQRAAAATRGASVWLACWRWQAIHPRRCVWPFRCAPLLPRTCALQTRLDLRSPPALVCLPLSSLPCLAVRPTGACGRLRCGQHPLARAAAALPGHVRRQRGRQPAPAPLHLRGGPVPATQRRPW